MAFSYRSQCVKQTPNRANFQNRNHSGDKELHLQGGMGGFGRSVRHVLPHPHSSKATKSSMISCGRSFISVQSSIFWYSNSSTWIQCHYQRGKTRASKQRHLDTPVFRLVTSSPITADLLGAVKTTGGVCSGTRLGYKLQKVRVNTNPKFWLPRVHSFDLNKGEVALTEKKLADFDKVHRRVKNHLDNYSPNSNVIHRDSGILWKDSPNGQITCESIPMVYKNPLEISPVVGLLRDSKKHLSWWSNLKNVLVGCSLHAEEYNVLLFTDASMKGWWAHLGDLTVSGMWSATETNLHINIVEWKTLFLAIKSFQTYLLNKRVLVASGNATVVSYLNKRGVGGGTSFSGTRRLCLLSNSSHSKTD